MALVTITGNVQDHNREPVPEELQPELWFRPRRAGYVNGLSTAREVKATLFSGGGFAVEVESAPGVYYVPVVRWLSDPSQADEDIQNRAYGYNEWDPVWPADGGPISGLPRDPIQIDGVWYGYGPPPEYLSGALYVDISGVKLRAYAPAGRGV